MPRACRWMVETAASTPPNSPGRGVTDESEVYGSTMPAAVARADRSRLEGWATTTTLQLPPAGERGAGVWC